MLTAHAAAVIGGLFIAAAVLLWAGWALLPVRIGPFFEPGQFAAIRASFRTWIWLYRLHLFGYVISAMAFVALATEVGTPARVLVWPGAAIATAGAFVSALAAAFYYHFGAWGAVSFGERPVDSAAAHVESLRLSTEYVTCLVRFGRVFFGLGQLVVAAGLLDTTLLPAWLAIAAAVLGIAAIALTMARPDDLHLYHPVFHLNAVWLLLAGVLLFGAAG